MRANLLYECYIDELRDLYNAENQILKALPKMAKAASSGELRSGFEEHLAQTEEHVARLKDIFEKLDESPKGKVCKGMRGLIQEGQEFIEDDLEPARLDAILIAAAQRVEHYEMAGYGCVRMYAKLLNDDEASRLLETTLNEEKETDAKLSKLAEDVNLKALETSSEERRSTKNASKQLKKAVTA
jgi:ferritin-like metal-binding protein YciE